MGSGFPHLPPIKERVDLLDMEGRFVRRHTRSFLSVLLPPTKPPLLTLPQKRPWSIQRLREIRHQSAFAKGPRARTPKLPPPGGAVPKLGEGRGHRAAIRSAACLPMRMQSGTPIP